MRVPRFRILIVEDDDPFFRSMQRTLKLEMQERNLDVEIVREVALAGAKRKIKEMTFDLISTDMGLPMFPDGNSMRASGGALLVSWSLRRKTVPFVIYSGNDVEETKKMLLSEGVGSLPPIFQKDPSCGHGAWAKHILETLLK